MLFNGKPVAVENGTCSACGREYDDIHAGACPATDCPSNQESAATFFHPVEINKAITLDLDGLDGNAFALMGAFQHQARREHWTPDEICTVLLEMSNGDYDHLLQTLIKYTQPADGGDE